MIVGAISRLLTGACGARDGLLEAPPLAVAQQQLQVASTPVFRAVRVGLLDGLEGRVAEGRQLLAIHRCGSLPRVAARLPNDLASVAAGRLTRRAIRACVKSRRWRHGDLMNPSNGVALTQCFFSWSIAKGKPGRLQETTRSQSACLTQATTTREMLLSTSWTQLMWT